MRVFRTLTVTALLGLAACASPRTPDTRLPSAFEVSQAPAQSVALDRWWLAFDDPQLTGLIDQALAANTDVRLAAARLQEVRAQRTSGLTQFLPQGDLNASGRRTETTQLSGTRIDFPGFSSSGVSEAYSANFNVSWEVDLFGRVFAALRAANADVDAVRYAYEGSRAAIAAQVADSYFQARGLAIQLADAEQTVRIRRELYDVATKRAQIGVATTADADRVASDLAQAQSQVAAFNAELQAQRRDILILAGRVVEPTANIDVPPAVGVPPPVPATLPSELLARRPDIREAEARIRGAAGRQDLAGLAFFPTFLLTPGIGWSKQSQPGFETESRSWTIGGSVSQPILSIPRLLADLKAQNARTEQAVLNYEKTVQTAFGEAEDTLVRLDADRRRVALLTEGEVRAQRAYRAARLGYDRGLVDLDSTLTAEQQWRVIRAQLTAAQVQALRRAVQAYRAIGGGWPGATTQTLAQAN